MGQATNQSYHLRALLYSLWNGQPTSLLEIVSLDWDLRKDLLAVLAAFGWEEPNNPSNAAYSFFYTAIEQQLRQACLFEWFIAEHKLSR